MIVGQNGIINCNIETVLPRDEREGGRVMFQLIVLIFHSHCAILFAVNYKKLKSQLDKQFKLAIGLDGYSDKWMRVNSDDPNSQVYSGHLTTVPQCPKPSFTVSCKKR